MTAREAEVLRVFLSLCNSRMAPPTVRELGQELGLRSSATAQGHLRKLVESGYLQHGDMVSRPFRPLSVEQLLDASKGFLTKNRGRHA